MSDNRCCYRIPLCIGCRFRDRFCHIHNICCDSRTSITQHRAHSISSCRCNSICYRYIPRRGIQTSYIHLCSFTKNNPIRIDNIYFVASINYTIDIGSISSRDNIHVILGFSSIIKLHSLSPCYRKVLPINNIIGNRTIDVGCRSRSCNCGTRYNFACAICSCRYHVSTSRCPIRHRHNAKHPCCQRNANLQSNFLYLFIPLHLKHLFLVCIIKLFYYILFIALNLKYILLHKLEHPVWKRLAFSHTGFSIYFLLLQQTENRRTALISLCQHRLGCLQQDIVFRISSHFLGHICISNY